MEFPKTRKVISGNYNFKNKYLFTQLISRKISFILGLGWSLEEFDALRKYGMRPPKEMTADSLGEMVRSDEYPIGNKKFALKRWDQFAVLQALI